MSSKPFGVIASAVRSPTIRVLINTVDIYVAANQVDTDAGAKFVLPATPTYRAVPCTVQVMEYESQVADQERIERRLHYKVMFGSYQAVNPRDVLVYVDPQGVNHTLFVDAQRDEAGRGAAYTVRCTELD